MIRAVRGRLTGGVAGKVPAANRLNPPERYEKYIQMFEDVKAESGV